MHNYISNTSQYIRLLKSLSSDNDQYGPYVYCLPFGLAYMHLLLAIMKLNAHMYTTIKTAGCVRETENDPVIAATVQCSLITTVRENESRYKYIP